MLEQSVMDTNQSIQTDDARSRVKTATVSRAWQIADFITLGFSPDPVHQNKGYGAGWLKHTLAVGDREGKPAYLESSNPRSIPSYKRFGFELTGKIQVG